VNCWDIGSGRSVSRFRFEAQVRALALNSLFVLCCDCCTFSSVDPPLFFLFRCALIPEQVFALAVKPDEPSRPQLAVGSVISPERHDERDCGEGL
jgi:hypothetical protein